MSCQDVDETFRTADGSCNNLDRPSIGKSKGVYIRELPNAYCDGYQTPRTCSADGGNLPSSRRVSFTLFPELNRPDHDCSLLMMQFGQFIDHDIALAGNTKVPNGKGISCCSEIYTDFPEFLHPECFAIRLPPDDPYYAQYGEYCMNFVRSAATSRPNCYLGPREQINQVTSWIDGSQIYGSDMSRQELVRASSDGLLLTTTINNRPNLPYQEQGGARNDGPDICQSPDPDKKCFYAGDLRANLVVHITVLQTIFLREHNRVAGIMSRLNPHWSDEVLFQETRRVVAAEMQHIVYNEFLPNLLNYDTLVKYELLLKRQGYFRGYDPSVDGRIGIAFGAAAYRLHSLIQGKCLMNRQSHSYSFNLSQVFNNPEMLYTPGCLDGLTRGLVDEPQQQHDRWFTTEITNQLFRLHDKHYGLDLLAIDVQRGRDSGLPGYTQYRTYCGLSEINTWEDMVVVLGQDNTDRIRTIYRTVEVNN